MFPPCNPTDLALGPDAIEDLRSQLVTTLESPSGAVSSVHQRVLERVGHLLMRVPPWIELDRRLTAIFAKATQILEGINDLSSTQEISSLQDLRLLDGDDDTALAGSVAIEDIPSEDRNFGTLFLKKTLQVSGCIPLLNRSIKYLAGLLPNGTTSRYTRLRSPNILRTGGT